VISWRDGAIQTSVEVENEPTTRGISTVTELDVIHKLQVTNYSSHEHNGCMNMCDSQIHRHTVLVADRRSHVTHWTVNETVNKLDGRQASCRQNI